MSSIRLLSCKAIAVMALMVLISAGFAQDKEVRPSLSATTSQVLGADSKITIDYSRPGVKGRKIWGELVPFGMAPGNKYSNDKPYPWRAGANENTTIEFSSDVQIEGRKLLAGKYGIHMIPSEKEWVVIFSKDNAIWGSYAYNEANDALRVTVMPVAAAHQEWLSYSFEDLAGNSATIVLHWEKLKIPVKVALAAE